MQSQTQQERKQSPTTDEKRLAAVISTLQQNKEEWATLAIAEKLEILKSVRSKTGALAERWVAAAVEAKGLPPDEPLAGEEWLSGPYAFLSNVNLLLETLTGLLKQGCPPLPERGIRVRADGQVVVQVFPHDIYDRIFLNGFRAEVWMQPEVTRKNIKSHMAGFYGSGSRRGQVVLVLGAGNIASIPPMDVLYKLFAEGKVCLLKMNPVNDYLGPIFEECLAPLVDRGFLYFAYGGVDVGAMLTGDEGVEEIHITGSARSHDAIVYGTGEKGALRKQRDEPILRKKITSELGGVSPTIVVPGPWTPADFRFQAEHLATQKFHNSGFNCVASQVVVLPDAWGGSAMLLEAYREVVAGLPSRPAYYPGAAERQREAVKAHPKAEEVDAEVPRTLITDLDPNNDEEYCFREEFFAPVLAQTTLPESDPLSFLRAAIQFSNERLHGTLGASILIHPKTQTALGSAFEDAIAELHYGSIGINAWTGVGYALSQTTWGAFPGHTSQDIQSGCGVVHNTLLFDKPQKSVVYQPFHPFPRSIRNRECHLMPKPPWFVGHSKAGLVGRRLTYFAANPGLHHIPGIVTAALAG